MSVGICFRRASFLFCKQMSETQKCPICLAEVVYFPRYPKSVCQSCFARTTDENNRPLKFSNTTMLGGGFAAEYADTNEKRESHICYIDGIKCRADEHRFGGIVIQIYDRE
jgi:hypothetical protein